MINMIFGRGRSKWMQWFIIGQTFLILLVFRGFLFSEQTALVAFSSLPNYQYDNSVWPESGSSLASKEMELMDKAFLELITPSDIRIDVFEASVGLTWLKVPENITSDTTSYQGVEGSFCPVDWTRQKKEPHTVPRYSNVYNGDTCNKHNMAEVVFDFADLVKMTRRYDRLVGDKVNHLDTAGIIYHESRSGSTLAANMLTVGYPDTSRVYSEPTVLLRAMKSNNTDLVRDVLYMLGRTNNTKEKRVFYKLKSDAVRYIHTMPPEIPWIFMYRKPEEVVASHFNPTETESTVCLMERKHPHPLLVEISKKFDNTKDTRKMTDENFCAARLASLCLAAIREHQRTGKGHFVNYNLMPEILWETIVPKYFQVQITPTAISRMKNISQVYSKGKVDNTKEWNNNIKKKVTKEQQKSAHKILAPYFVQMEKFARQQPR
jgi:hypothetical protein